MVARSWAEPSKPTSGLLQARRRVFSFLRERHSGPLRPAGRHPQSPAGVPLAVFVNGSRRRAHRLGRGPSGEA